MPCLMIIMNCRQTVDHNMTVHNTIVIKKLQMPVMVRPHNAISVAISQAALKNIIQRLGIHTPLFCERAC